MTSQCRLDSFACIVIHGPKKRPTSWFSGVSLRIGETGEYCKVAGGLLWKGKALLGNKQNLAGEFCVVAEEFSDLRCLMNTLGFERVQHLNEKSRPKTISQ